MSTTARGAIATPPRRTAQAQWPAGQRGPARSSRPLGQPPATVTPDAPPQPALLQRRRTQRLAVTLIVAAAVFTVVMGVLYLSGYASLQFELNRRIKLQSQLRAAQEMSKLYQEHLAKVNSNEYIENEAKIAGMKAANEGQTVIIGETN